MAVCSPIGLGGGRTVLHGRKSEIMIGRAVREVLSSRNRGVLPAVLAALATGCAAQGPAAPQPAAAQAAISQSVAPPSASTQASPPQSASPGGMGWSSNYPRHTAAGQPVEIGHWADFSYGQGRRGVACQAHKPPDIEVTEQPQNGAISVRPAAVEITRSHSGLCIGRKVSGVEVIYTPRPDFRGMERVHYQARFGDGSRQSVTATITVE